MYPSQSVISVVSVEIYVVLLQTDDVDDTEAASKPRAAATSAFRCVVRWDREAMWAATRLLSSSDTCVSARKCPLWAAAHTTAASATATRKRIFLWLVRKLSAKKKNRSERIRMLFLWVFVCLLARLIAVCGAGEKAFS